MGAGQSALQLPSRNDVINLRPVRYPKALLEDVPQITAAVQEMVKTAQLLDLAADKAGKQREGLEAVIGQIDAYISKLQERKALLQSTRNKTALFQVGYKEQAANLGSLVSKARSYQQQKNLKTMQNSSQVAAVKAGSNGNYNASKKAGNSGNKGNKGSSGNKGNKIPNPLPQQIPLRQLNLAKTGVNAELNKVLRQLG